MRKACAVRSDQMDISGATMRSASEIFRFRIVRFRVHKLRPSVSCALVAEDVFYYFFYCIAAARARCDLTSEYNSI